MGNEKTMKNLMEAFAGESMANRKYTAFAKKAEAEISIFKIVQSSCRWETRMRRARNCGKVKST